MVKAFRGLIKVCSNLEYSKSKKLCKIVSSHSKEERKKGDTYQYICYTKPASSTGVRSDISGTCRDRVEISVLSVLNIEHIAGSQLQYPKFSCSLVTLFKYLQSHL